MLSTIIANVARNKVNSTIKYHIIYSIACLVRILEILLIVSIVYIMLVVYMIAL